MHPVREFRTVSNMLRQDAGTTLRMARWKADLSIRDLSDKANVDKTTISKVENGGAVDGRVVVRLAKALEVDPDELFEAAAS